MIPYLNFFAKANVELALETGHDLASHWFVWHTGRQNSLLLNLYFLPIITSALALGRLTTLLEVGLIGACYLYLSKAAYPVTRYFP